MFGFIHWFFINQKADLSWETIIGFIKALTVRNEISVHFWFVYSIIGLYIISQPMNYLFKNIGPAHAGFAILIIGLLIMYNGDLVSLSHVLPIPGIDKWASYFIAGGLIARIKKNVSLKQCALTAIFGYLLIVLLSVLNGANKTPMPYDNSISMFITCCGVVLFFSKIPAQESVLIKNLSHYTYGAYLIHICILKVVAPIYFKYIHLPGVLNYFISTIILAVIVFIFSMLISKIITPIIDVIMSTRIKKAA